MFNRIQQAETIMVAIPAGGCSTVMPLLIGADLVGIPQGTYGAGTTGNVTVHLEGAFRGLPLKTGDTPAVGDKLYWDNGNSYLTTTSGGNVWAGWAWPILDTGDTATAYVVGDTTTVALKLKTS
jgi:predicted RecA/RadA family phage recombinase